MKKLFLIASLLISSMIIFGQEIVTIQVDNMQHPSVSQAVYKSMEGLWNTPSDGDMDIILNVNPKGEFTLSIIPAFEFTNITAIEQSQVIKEHIVEKGYFKVLNTLHQDITNNIISANMEILLNGELSTNNLEITFSKVFILNSDTNTNNIVKSSTNHIVKELFLLR